MSVPQAIASIEERLALVPNEADATLVIRHAERGEIPSGAYGMDVALTAKGVAAAERLGAALVGDRQLSVTSSPVPRCVQTAEALFGEAAVAITLCWTGGWETQDLSSSTRRPAGRFS